MSGPCVSGPWLPAHVRGTSPGAAPLRLTDAVTLVGANFAPSRWLAAPALGPALTPLLTGTPANGIGGDRPTGDLAVVAAPLPSACQGAQAVSLSNGPTSAPAGVPASPFTLARFASLADLQDALVAFEPRLDSGAGLPRVAGRRAVAAVGGGPPHVARHVMRYHF